MEQIKNINYKKNKVKEYIEKNDISNSKFIDPINEYLESNEYYSCNKMKKLYSKLLNNEYKLNKLTEALNKINIKFDSIELLFKKYFDDVEFFTLEYVINVVSEIKWFISNTNYLSDLKEHKNKILKYCQNNKLPVEYANNIFYDCSFVFLKKHDLIETLTDEQINNILWQHVNLVLNNCDSYENVLNKFVQFKTLTKYYDIVEEKDEKSDVVFPKIIIDKYPQILLDFEKEKQEKIFKFDLFNNIFGEELNSIKPNLINNLINNFIENNIETKTKNKINLIENLANNKFDTNNCIEFTCNNSRAVNCLENKCKLCCVNKNCYGHKKK